MIILPVVAPPRECSLHTDTTGHKSSNFLMVDHFFKNYDFKKINIFNVRVLYVENNGMIGFARTDLVPKL